MVPGFNLTNLDYAICDLKIINTIKYLLSIIVIFNNMVEEHKSLY